MATGKKSETSGLLTSKLLYRSENLRVVAVPGADRDRWFVTFDSLRPDTDLDRKGFGEDFFQQRGLSAEEATALIVNGFVKDVLQHLPMEFAVEAQKLISISLEGSVG